MLSKFERRGRHHDNRHYQNDAFRIANSEKGADDQKSGKAFNLQRQRTYRPQPYGPTVTTKIASRESHAATRKRLSIIMGAYT